LPDMPFYTECFVNFYWKNKGKKKDYVYFWRKYLYGIVMLKSCREKVDKYIFKESYKCYT